jgi:hypothetical protein
VELMDDLAMHQAPRRKAPGSREAPGAKRTSIHLSRYSSESAEKSQEKSSAYVLASFPGAVRI